jgi:hypothetical protein
VYLISQIKKRNSLSLQIEQARLRLHRIPPALTVANSSAMCEYFDRQMGALSRNGKKSHRGVSELIKIIPLLLFAHASDTPGNELGYLEEKKKQ